MNGSMNPSGISPGDGMHSNNHTDHDANTMADYVLTDSLNSPEAFDMKTIFGTQPGVGPLDTLGGGVHAQGNPHHGHTLSSGNMSMEGVETSSGQPFGLTPMAGPGMMGIGMGAIGGAPPASIQGATMLGSGTGNGGLGVSTMMTDKTSPSTGSGEGDEEQDEEPPTRGRRVTRFPAGVGKQEDEPTVL